MKRDCVSDIGIKKNDIEFFPAFHQKQPGIHYNNGGVFVCLEIEIVPRDVTDILVQLHNGYERGRVVFSYVFR